MKYTNKEICRKLELANNRNDLITIQYLVSLGIKNGSYMFMSWAIENNMYNVVYIILKRFTQYSIINCTKSIKIAIELKRTKILSYIFKNNFFMNSLKSEDESLYDKLHKKYIRLEKIKKLIN